MNPQIWWCSCTPPWKQRFLHSSPWDSCKCVSGGVSCLYSNYRGLNHNIKSKNFWRFLHTIQKVHLRTQIVGRRLVTTILIWKVLWKFNKMDTNTSKSRHWMIMRRPICKSRFHGQSLNKHHNNLHLTYGILTSQIKTSSIRNDSTP